ncbi:hypothetical protein SASPL_132574 [Salvia splendens]|uniref:RING-type E3 ubiquitin transferase n=1 Tax=Salvia splendens TaxID=180675 RepID=A0A8X8X1D8_SALSN|nr:hypothetical protein SASPL_132574 [Salvia splendens]
MAATRALKFETILWSPWTSEEHDAAMNQVAQHRHQGSSIEVSLVQLTAAPVPHPLSLLLPEFGLVIRVLSPFQDLDDVLSGFMTRRCDDDADIQDEKEVCCICLDDLYRGSVTALDCGHEFHPGCIRRWLFRGNNFCPLCKAPAMKRPRVTLASLLQQ